MIERIIIIDGVDPQTFYGVNNANISLIRNLFPKLRVSARGNVVKVIGEEHETAEFEKKLKEIEHTPQNTTSLRRRRSSTWLAARLLAVWTPRG